MQRVPAPWVLKPRSEASAIGIKKMHAPDDVGARSNSSATARALPHRALRPRRHLPRRLHRYEGKVVFTSVSGYGKPPMQVMHEGGVFTTRILDRDSHRDPISPKSTPTSCPPSAWLAASPTPSTSGPGRRRFYFLEAAARVGGAFIADLVQSATGLNLWREWARLEVANLRGELPCRPNLTRSTRSVLCLRRPPSPTPPF